MKIIIHLSLVFLLWANMAYARNPFVSFLDTLHYQRYEAEQEKIRAAEEAKRQQEEQEKLEREMLRREKERKAMNIQQLAFEKPVEAITRTLRALDHSRDIVRAS